MKWSWFIINRVLFLGYLYPYSMEDNIIRLFEEYETTKGMINALKAKKYSPRSSMGVHEGRY
jgi:hypothetical protein